MTLADFPPPVASPPPRAGSLPFAAMQAYLLGTSSTRFHRHPDRDFRSLADEVVRAALADGGMEDGSAIGSAWFGNCAMGTWGQQNIRGQVALAPLLRDGTLPERLPIVNVEGGCATGSMAFHAACRDVRAGDVDVSLAVGVEKVFVPDDPVATFALFQGGVDQRHPQEWQAFFAEQGERTGLRFEPHPHRILFLDVHALQARAHMQRFGTTVEQLAAVAAKNHDHGVHNPLAQYRKSMTVEEVLADKPVLEPFTRAMCSPLSDGAAAVIVCSEAWLRRQSAEVQDRAVGVRGSALVGGTLRDLEDLAVVHHAAREAYARAGIKGTDVDVAEVHDSTAYCEIVATEALGFCGLGEGGPLAASGETRVGGRIPVNPSGGLESKGHPLAATGLGMLHELAQQLRGEAGDKQVPGTPRIGVQQNAGGLIGYDEATCSVVVLER
jgi:acetyl-CoA acetyltransferase